MSLKDQALQYWEGRSTQEKRMLGGGALVLLLALVYAAGFDPAWRGRVQLQRDLPNLRQEAAQMQALAAEAIELQKRPPVPVTPLSKDSLAASLAARTLQPASLLVTGEFVKAEFKSVSFASLHAWLDQLRRENMISVQEANIVPQGPVGNVDATLTLRQHLPQEASPQ